MTKDEALKMAIEALEDFSTQYARLEPIINACKEALEQPAQEPVAWINEDELPDEYPYDEMFKHSEIVYGVRVFPVYSPKHQWQGLTDEQSVELFINCLSADETLLLNNISSEQIIKYFRAIEQALKEKNT